MRRTPIICALCLASAAVLLAVGSALASAATGPVLLGSQSVATTQDGGAGASEAFGYTASVAGTATSISVYLDSNSGVALGVYSDRSSKPGVRLDHASVATNAAGWVTVPLSGGVKISSGTRYWIAIAATGDSRTIGYRDTGHSGSSLDYSGTGMMSPYSVSQQWNSNPASVYVSGTTSPPPPPSAPTIAASPVVSGTASRGLTLSTSKGTWTGSPTSYSYQWQGCNSSGTSCTSISGATSSSYVLAAGDVGHTMRAVVTATNSAGSTQASSAPTAAVSSSLPSAPTNTVLQVVGGTATQGQALTSTSGSWTNSPTGYAYQWQDCNGSGAGCTSINGAASNSYMLASGDVGHTMRVVVTATNTSGSTPATSLATGMVSSGSQTCTQTFTPSNIGSSPYPGSSVLSALSSANGGAVICFASGSYGEIDLYAVHPSGNVTLEPAPGATVGMGFMNLNGVSNLTITGFSAPSSSGGMLLQVAGQGNNSNVTFSYNSMSSNGVNISNNALANAHINVLHNTFAGFASSGESSRVNVVSDNSCPNGITIGYNTMSGGQADGIDTSGSSCGTQIVHNDISGIIEGNCGGIHCDGFQDNGGGTGTVLSGNYFHNNSDCFLLDDGSSNITITGNVCITASNSSYWMQFGGSQTISLTHNTIVSSQGAQYGNDHGGNPSSNVTFKNNVWPSAPVDNPGQPPSGTNVEDYNLSASGGSGSHEITGAPTFTGGASPSSWTGFALSSGSSGVGNASDGLNHGVADFSVTPGS